MACPRCAIEHDLQDSGWCADCERACGVGPRRPAGHAVRLALCVLVAGGIALLTIMLGFGFLSPLSAFPSLWAIHALSELHDRRRHQRLVDARLPRAYLASKT